MPKSSSKVLFKLNIFFMVSFIILLGTRNQNIEMRSSNHITKSIAQRLMTKTRFEHRFPDLKYFEVGFLF
jgi:hypothetical protein